MSKVVWSNMSQIVSEPVRWLWDGRIPAGKVTLLEGEPGSGKSTLALDLAAKVSRGGTMPLTRQPTTPADVLIYSGDDDLADTVRPRLEAAGADLSRIHPVSGEIHKADIEAMRPALIVLDPLSGYLCLTCGETPRQVMQELAALARDTDAAVLAVQSLPSKQESDWPREIYAVARSVLAISSVGLGGRRLAVVKSNLRPVSEVHPLVYHHEDDDGVLRIIGWSDGR